MTPIIAKYLTSHQYSSNSNSYVPTWTNTDARQPVVTNGTMGYYTPVYFGIHNPSSSSQTVTVWTIAQGSTGSGVSVNIPAGGIFYASIAKINVTNGNTVVLLGSPYDPNYL